LVFDGLTHGSFEFCDACNIPGRRSVWSPPTDDNDSTGGKVSFDFLEPRFVLFPVSFDLAFAETGDFEVVSSGLG
jgi:hypothetical protein